MEGTLINLVIQALAGAAGGAGAGTAFKDLSMGKPADAISGGVGGAVIGQILGSVLGAGAAATDVGGMDVATLVRDIVGGGVGGAVVMALIGMLRNAMKG